MPCRRPVRFFCTKCATRSGIGEVRVIEDNAVDGELETMERLTVPDQYGVSSSSPCSRAEARRGRTGLDEVEGDVKRRLSRQLQGVDGVGILVKAARGDVDAFEVVCTRSSSCS